MPYRKDSGPTKCGVKSDWGWGKKKLKGVGVADLGFCCADFRQTSRGNDSKTFLAWRTTLQDYLEKYNNLVLCHLRKHRLQKKPLKSDLKSISFRNFDNFFWIFIKRPQSGNTDVWSRFFSIFLDAITKKRVLKFLKNWVSGAPSKTISSVNFGLWVKWNLGKFWKDDRCFFA